MTHQARTVTVRRDVAGAVALAATLGIAAGCWVIAVRRMAGMDMGSDMGPATELGSFGSFVGLWVTMMAAMMLPAAGPAVVRRARADLRRVPLFLASYLAVWTVVGVVAYLLYRPHGTLAAGLAVIAAGLYELTPVKRRCRRYCRERAGSGVEYGLHCLGSSAGLMLALVALGPMSPTWMAVAGAVVLEQKLWPGRPAIDVPVALLIVALGSLTVLVPGSVPGVVS
jgi:predicted metal-binding membrane protein